MSNHSRGLVTGTYELEIKSLKFKVRFKQSKIKQNKIYTKQDLHKTRFTQNKIYTKQDLPKTRFTQNKIYTKQDQICKIINFKSILAVLNFTCFGITNYKSPNIQKPSLKTITSQAIYFFILL